MPWNFEEGALANGLHSALVAMLEKHETQDSIESSEGEPCEGHSGRTTILPPMPEWMAEGQEPPESAIVRRRRPARGVVFEFESIANRMPPRRVA